MLITGVDNSELWSIFKPKQKEQGMDKTAYWGVL